MRRDCRVLHFGRFDSNAYGGLERHVRLLLAGLTDYVHVDNLVAADVLGGPRVETRDGYTVYRAPSWGLIASTAIAPQLLWQARRLERRQHYDIVHLHFPDPLSHLATLLFPRTTKVVISWHSDIVRQERLLSLYQPFVDRLLRRVDAVIAATPAHFESSTQISACPPGRRHVVPFGVDYRVFGASDSLLERAGQIRASHGSKRLIFAVGRHVYYKGFEYLIRAMRDVDGVLLLGGSGPLTDTLRSLAQEAGVAGKVRFPGRIPDSDLPAYYHAADVFCLPSVERSEQFGLVQLEAMACRKPVVCCELHNGVTYVNQDGVTGIVVQPRDPDALARAINTLLNDEGLRKRLGEAGYRRATGEFSLEKMVSGTLAVYDKVLDSQPRPLEQSLQPALQSEVQRARRAGTVPGAIETGTTEDIGVVRNHVAASASVMPSVSVSIVMHDPDIDLLERTLGSLAEALRSCGDPIARQSSVWLIDNSDQEDARLPPVIERFRADASVIGCEVHHCHGQGNLGYGQGHNLALAEVCSEFHLVLNPDVVMDSEALVQACRFFGEHEDVGLIAPAATDATGAVVYLCKRYPTVLDLGLRGFAPSCVKRVFAGRLAHYEMRDAIDHERVFRDPPIVSGCWMMFRTSVLKRLGGFDPRFFLYFEDFDLSLRAASVTRLASVPEVRITHFGGHAANKGARHVGLFLRSAIQFWNKHGWRWS